MSDSLPNNPAVELHRELIAAGVLAPTPDNNQPWLFETQGDQLRIHVDPSRTLPSDVNRMFDLLGIGAAIENISIAARERGLETGVQFPSPEALSATPNLAATLTFESGGERDPLFAHLKSRCTNRKLYAKTPPTEAVLARLTEAASRFDEIQIDWICDRPRIKAMAALVSATDLIRFQYQPFHQEIFRQLRFSAEEAERTCDGLDLRTLELPPGVSLALRGLRSWTVMKWLHRLGLGRLLTVPSGVAIRRSGALGVISTSTPSSARFIEGGRAFERLWLKCDQEGLALQPLGSPSIFFAHLEVLGGAKLSEGHKAQIGKLIQRFREIVPAVGKRHLLMAVRVGNSFPPSHRSIRRAIDDVRMQN